MSQNHVAEQRSEGHGVTEQGIEGNPIEEEYPATALDSSAASNLVEQSNGVNQLPFESATHTYQDNVTVGTFSGNALEAMNQIENVNLHTGVLDGTEQEDPDDGNSIEDTAKDDMFVDCPDELITSDGRQNDSKEETEDGESKENSVENQQSHFGKLGNGVGDGSLIDELEQLRHALGKTAAEKESITREYQEEKETFAQGVLDLLCQLKALSCQQSLQHEDEVVVRDKEAQLADIPLKEMIKECLEFVNTTSEERSNAEATIRNLHALLSVKDHEIENLNTKVSELLVSHDNLAQKTLEVSSEIQLETDHNINIVIDRIGSSLATVVNQEQVLENSISGKIVHIEEGTSFLIEKYTNILSEIYQLGQSFSEAGLDTREQEYGKVLVAARRGLLELKRKEEELVEKLAQLEDENRKLVEELDQERVMIGTLNAEVGNMKSELEQEKVKCANTKEKLGMAVTKGKALVQQRDSLKQSLTNKSSELERCLMELQEKSAALEAARLTKDELVQSENTVASLQNSLLQCDTIIEQVEKILSQTEPDKPELLDMLERLRWIVDDRNVLKGAFLELCKLKDALSLVSIPETVSSSDLESQMNWLRDSFHRARDDTKILQEEISTIKEAAHNCIDGLSASHLLELQEKDYLQSELTDLRCKYEEIVDKNHQISMEKDQIVKMLVELSGLNLEDKEIDYSSSDTSMIINLCFQMIKQQSDPFSRSSHTDTELFERIQSLLYVRDQGLMLYEDILEEEMLIRSEVHKVSNELKMASDEILALKEEKGSLQKDLEQSEEKSAVLRDKLSMAVKKGKGLVQDRDNLKSLLNEKNLEIEKCLMELQEKSAGLEAARLTKDELIQSENTVAYLQNSLLQSNAISEQVEKILSQTEPDKPELLDMLERLRWIVDDRNVLKGAFLEFCKLKDALSLVNLPESVSSSDLESQINWLRASFHRARDDTKILQEEISTIKEAAHNCIDGLSASHLLELQEKDYLQSELTDLRCKYEEIVDKNHQISMEKDQIVKMLVELSGLNLEDEGVDYSSYDISMIINLCFQMIKQQSGPFSRPSHIDTELFERIQSLLYVRDQGLMLYEDILEEEMLIRSEVHKLSNELKMASDEILALKEEKGSLQKDLERSEEKSIVLRDKLSMAVKKGKGLVQDRDNLKGLLNEKNLEIEQLKLELQNQESVVSEYRDRINRLSSDVESIPKLEADLLAVKSERNQFEQFLLESNNMLQRVIESIDRIDLPIDSVFEEPVAKVKWLAAYVSECHDAKLHAEQELQLVKEGATNLESAVAEAQSTVKSLEQELSSSGNSISQVAEEKRELELGKAKVEEELLKVKEEVAEVYASTKFLRDALSQAEKDISVLSNEKELAQNGRTAAETELERVKEEAARLTSKLAETSITIKDLEDTLSQAESNVSLLNEKCNADQVVKTNMENELKKLQDESEHQASKLVDTSATVKSLGDALLKAQDGISILEDTNRIAKEEISSLSFKLNSCLDELAGKNGGLESRSIELIGLLNDLKVLMVEDTLLPRVKQCFERKFETLKNMDLILNKIRDYIVGMTAKNPERHHVTEEDPFVRKASFDGLENFDVEVDNRVISDTDMDNIISLLGNILKGFQLRNKLISDRFDDFSDSMDEFISLLQTKLLETETDMISIFEHMENLKEKVNTGESLKKEEENTIATLENDITVLLSACADASSELQNLVESGSISEITNLDADALAKHHQNSKHMETAQSLINVTRKAQSLIKQLEVRSKEVDATIEDLRNKLNETSAASERVIEERDQSQNRVLQLESDIQVLQNSCSELRNTLEGYNALEEQLKEKEAEISSLHSALLTKEQEVESSLLSASRVRTLFGKIDRIEIPIIESGEDNMEPNTPAPVQKLFYIIDSFTSLHHQMNSLSHEKEELQSTLATKVLENKHLKEEVKQLNSNWEDLEKVKNELSEFTFALEKVLGMLGASDWVEDQKSTGLKELIPLLEKQVMAILLESENSKSKAQELGSKLLGSQKVIDELTTKVKLLEDSLHDRTSQPEIVQERSLIEAPSLSAGSEISEVEEGSLGKKAISPVPSAAHVRNMRKGSTDHLALDIDVESDRLINRADTDEDKGHVFKSLNTSGFVPKQGKLIADRIDGIWVSGSRILMSRPRARLGLVGYLLVLHIWLLGAIL